MEKIIYKIYQKIGNYLTGKRKQTFVFLVIVFIILIFFSIYYPIKIPKDTLYWVFSSIVQSLVALVALLGIAIIFKLQTVKNSEERILNNELIRNDIETFNGKTVPISSVEELLSIINKILKRRDYPPPLNSEVERLKEIKLKINGFFTLKDFMRDFMIEFTIYTFTIVILNLIFLAFVHIIYQYNFSLPSLFLVIILTTYSLFLIIKGFSESLF